MIEYIMAWWSYTVIRTLHFFIIVIMQTFLTVLNCWYASPMYSVSSVCLGLGWFSQLSFMQYMGLCLFNLPIFSYDDCENICTWSYYHHQIGSMTRLQLFWVMSWNKCMRFMSFYILVELFQEHFFAIVDIFVYHRSIKQCVILIQFDQYPILNPTSN